MEKVKEGEKNEAKTQRGKENAKGHDRPQISNAGARTRDLKAQNEFGITLTPYPLSPDTLTLSGARGEKQVVGSEFGIKKEQLPFSAPGVRRGTEDALVLKMEIATSFVAKNAPPSSQ